MTDLEKLESKIDTQQKIIDEQQEMIDKLAEAVRINSNTIKTVKRANKE